MDLYSQLENQIFYSLLESNKLQEFKAQLQAISDRRENEKRQRIRKARQQEFMKRIDKQCGVIQTRIIHELGLNNQSAILQQVMQEVKYNLRREVDIQQYKLVKDSSLAIKIDHCISEYKAEKEKERSYLYKQSRLLIGRVPSTIDKKQGLQILKSFLQMLNVKAPAKDKVYLTVEWKAIQFTKAKQPYIYEAKVRPIVVYFQQQYEYNFNYWIDSRSKQTKFLQKIFEQLIHIANLRSMYDSLQQRLPYAIEYLRNRDYGTAWKVLSQSNLFDETKYLNDD